MNADTEPIHKNALRNPFCRGRIPIYDNRKLPYFFFLFAETTAGILGGNIRCQDFGHIVAEHYYIIAIFGDIRQDNLAVHAELRASHEYQLTVNRLVEVVDILLGLLIDELDVNILDAQFRIPEPDTLRLFHQRL